MPIVTMVIGFHFGASTGSSASAPGRPKNETRIMRMMTSITRMIETMNGTVMVLKVAWLAGPRILAAMKLAPQGIIEKARTATERPATGIQ